ncbi:MAG: c-type cytochrome [Leptospirillia bacterium]
MRYLPTLLTITLLLTALFPPAWAGGEKVFEKYGCTGCHAVSAYGVGVPSSNGKEYGNPPDLSEVGRRWDANFLKGLLNKKVTLLLGRKPTPHTDDTGMPDLRGHDTLPPFGGTRDELAELTGWLVTLTRAPLDPLE